jgi:hypothetical protein
MSDAEPVMSQPDLPAVSQADLGDEAPLGLIDLKNPQTLIFLGLGAVVLLAGLVLFVVLVSGG